MSAKTIAKAFGETILAINLADNVTEVVDDVEQKITEPLSMFFSHPNWPSRLTYWGVPVEFSIAIASNGIPSIRYSYDVTNYNKTLSENIERYYDQIRNLHAPPKQNAQFISIFNQHLERVPNWVRALVLYGIGYTFQLHKAYDLYFNSSWMSRIELEKRFPSCREILQSLANNQRPLKDFTQGGVEYEIFEYEIKRIKLLGYLENYGNARRLSDIKYVSPGLEHGSRVFENFYSINNPSQFPRSLGLQLYLDEKTKTLNEKLFFSCPAWGWGKPKGLLNLITFLLDTFDIDLYSLLIFLKTFAKHKILLKPSFFSIGSSDSNPSVGFYFYPVLDGLLWSLYKKGISSSASAYNMQRLEIIDNMLKKAENFILKVRSQEGGWGRSTSHFLNVWLTAYVIKTLAANNELCTLLTPSLSWLCSQLNKSYKWEQKSIDNLYSDGTALALLASNSLDWHTQKVRKQDLLLNLLRKKECSSNEKIYGTQEQDYEPLEITSLILLAKMRLGFERSELINGLENILCQQRTDGGWNSLWGKDVMFATYRVLDTLDAFAKTQNPKYCSDADRRMVYSYEKAVNSSLCFILDHTTASEPFALGLWLTSWFVAKGNKDFPSVDRILFKLSKQQQEDGRFCSTLIEPTGKTKLSWPVFLEHFELDVDRDLAVTTMVYNGLRETQKALRNNR